MHILIGLLGSIVAILYYLDRLGVDIGWLNPFAWARRRAWAKKYEGDPIHSVDDPMGIAAILVVGATRLGGDLTVEQKQSLLDLFQSTFSLNEKASNDLLTATTHLLGAPQVLRNQLDGVVERNTKTFDAEQSSSIIEMAETAAGFGQVVSEEQRDYLQSLQSSLAQREQQGSWA